jgi:hypothetical protein
MLRSADRPGQGRTAPAQAHFLASHPAALLQVKTLTVCLVLLSLLALPAAAPGFQQAAVAARLAHKHAPLMLMRRAAAVARPA